MGKVKVLGTLREENDGREVGIFSESQVEGVKRALSLPEVYFREGVKC